MPKIKLPRKRKKAYLNKFGKSNYIGIMLFNEILFEEIPKRKNTRFPEYNKQTFRLIKNW